MKGTMSIERSQAHTVCTGTQPESTHWDSHAVSERQRPFNKHLFLASAVLGLIVQLACVAGVVLSNLEIL